MLEIAVKKLIDEITGYTGNPLFSIGPYPAYSYKITHISGGVVMQSQLEIRLMGSDFDELLAKRDLIISKLDMTEQKPSLLLGEFVIRSELAGGGYLFNNEIQMWEIMPTFILKWRKKDGK